MNADGCCRAWGEWVLLARSTRSTYTHAVRQLKVVRQLKELLKRACEEWALRMHAARQLKARSSHTHAVRKLQAAWHEWMLLASSAVRLLKASEAMRMTALVRQLKVAWHEWLLLACRTSQHADAILAHISRSCIRQHASYAILARLSRSTPTRLSHA
jgi:hypothetical protein